MADTGTSLMCLNGIQHERSTARNGIGTIPQARVLLSAAASPLSRIRFSCSGKTALPWSFHVFFHKSWLGLPQAPGGTAGPRLAAIFHGIPRAFREPGADSRFVPSGLPSREQWKISDTARSAAGKFHHHLRQGQLLRAQASFLQRWWPGAGKVPQHAARTSVREECNSRFFPGIQYRPEKENFKFKLIHYQHVYSFSSTVLDLCWYMQWLSFHLHKWLSWCQTATQSKEYCKASATVCS